MNKSLKIYEPLIEIHLKDGDVLYTEAKNRNAIEAKWKSKEILAVGDVTLDPYGIKKIQSASCEFNLSKVAPKYRRSLAMRIKQFEEALNKSPTENEITNMLQKIINS